MSAASDRTAFWSQLAHQGVVLSPVVLPEFLDAVCGKNKPLPEPKFWLLRELRTRWTRFEAALETKTDLAAARREFVDWVLQRLLGHGDALLKRGAGELPPWAKAVTAGGKVLQPDRLLRHGDGPALLVRIDEGERLGIHGSRRRAAEFVQLLRRTGCPVGLFTNGAQWRLCWAGPDADAWVQGEAASWFGEGDEAPDALRGFLALLSPKALTAVAGADLPLHHAVRESRHRQGELSRRLGEQVRRAVEQLLAGLQAQVPPEADLKALYQAATRIVMRLVVLFFAESERRALLPRNEPAYDDHYGVEGLLAQLRAARHDAGAEALAERSGAWNRLLALFRLVYQGAPLGPTPIRAYGGELFRPGDAGDPDDPVRRELARLEAPHAAVTDLQVLELLEGLKYTELRLGKGRRGRTVPAPVDFGDLSTEYIGILYEGLLDFELRRVTAEEEAVVRLAVGREPYLPFRRLRGMAPAELKELLKKLAKEKDGDGDAAPAGEEAGEEAAAAGEPDHDPTIQERVRAWAHEAAAAWGRRGTTGTKLVPPASVYAPGEFYLVRWGGTRKGSGTFYTPPALAEPTTRRTLQPLCYDEEGRPRSPQEILDLRVCDPACGSGSFLVGALRYLTAAYVESLEAEIAADPERPRRFPHADPTDDPQRDDYIELDEGALSERARHRAKRYIAQRCLHGVDLNPLAVELCRVALWVETLDKELPFEFFAHHVKCGNSLVGAWLDQVEDYPLLAWARAGGSKEATKRIKDLRKDVVKPELKREVERMVAHRATGEVREGGAAVQRDMFAAAEAPPKRAVVEEAVDALQGLLRLPVHDADARERHWREEVRDHPHLRELRQAFDRWCAVWFWPVRGEGDGAALPTPRPWHHQPEALAGDVADLRARHRFFHWELEFPEVFCREGRPGFDAVIGNPPWDIQKPNSQEFFSNFDPVYRTYGKQEALGQQRLLFERDPAIAARWEDYEAFFKAMSNWVKQATAPWEDSLPGGKSGQEARAAWAALRGRREAVLAGPHPFHRQGGGDLNLYKLFLEQGWSLCREGGRLGFVVPSGLYTDKGSTELRDLFLERSRWDWVFAFENRRKIFDIHRSFKFCPVIVQKGGSTEALRCAFMRHDLADWERAEPPHRPYPVSRLRRYSPNTRAFVEIRNEVDEEFVQTVYSHGRYLGQYLDEVGAAVLREVDKTNDGKAGFFLPARRVAELLASSPTGDPRDQETLEYLHGLEVYPVFEGKNIHQYTDGWEAATIFMTMEKIEQWYSKKGKRRPELNLSSWLRPRLVFREVATSTNERSMIATVLPACSLTTYTLRAIDFGQEVMPLWLLGVLNSFAFDQAVRLRGNLHLSTAYEELPLPPDDNSFAAAVSEQVERILDPATGEVQARSARVELEASVMQWFGVSCEIANHILTVGQEDPLGFWRVEDDLPQETRMPSLVAKALAPTVRRP
jgi:hypothetical protein